jgi:hypothetical protein
MFPPAQSQLRPKTVRISTERDLTGVLKISTDKPKAMAPKRGNSLSSFG